MFWIPQKLRQHRDMEYRVYPCHGFQQLQAISQATNLGQDRERSNVSRAKLHGDTEPNDSSSRSYPEKDLITHCKFQVPPPHISITLLTALSSQNILTNLLNFLRCLLNPIRTDQRSLSQSLPAQRGDTPPTIPCLIQCHLDASLIAVVISELSQGKMILLATLPRQNTSTQHVFQGLDSLLRLTISLRVKSNTKRKLGTKSTVKTLPEFGYKFGVSI
jgi:hypothetical protein